MNSVFPFFPNIPSACLGEKLSLRGERVNLIPFVFLKVAFKLRPYGKEISVLIDAPSINIQ